MKSNFDPNELLKPEVLIGEDWFALSAIETNNEGLQIKFSRLDDDWTFIVQVSLLQPQNKGIEIFRLELLDGNKQPISWGGQYLPSFTQFIIEYFRFTLENL